MLEAVEQTEVLTVTEVIDDWEVRYRIIPIIPNVKIHVYVESKQAVLIFNDSAEIEFSWTSEAEIMFENIDVAEPIELLELLARLNRQLESDMQAVRQARQNTPQPDWDCLTLEHEPALEKSLEGMVYRTTAIDEDGSRFIVTWTPVKNYDELPDITDHCDWDNPSAVLAI